MNDSEFAEFIAEAWNLSDREYEQLLSDIDEYTDYDFDDERGDAWEEEVESEYELDDTWPDDDWLDPYEEWEISPDYGED